MWKHPIFSFVMVGQYSIDMFCENERACLSVSLSYSYLTKLIKYEPCTAAGGWNLTVLTVYNLGSCCFGHLPVSIFFSFFTRDSRQEIWKSWRYSILCELVLVPFPIFSCTKWSKPNESLLVGCTHVCNSSCTNSDFWQMLFVQLSENPIRSKQID